MINYLAERPNQIQESPTLRLTAKARELKAQGKDVIGLTIGEPDFDTPAPIQEAGIAAIRSGKTKYTPADGIPALKQAIVDKFKNENNLQYNTNQVIASCGAKHSIYNIFQAVLDPGDEVIILSPYWVSYPDIVKLADGVPVIIDASVNNQYKIRPEQLEQAITKKTKAIMINSPSNPTGAVYSAEELRELGAVLKKHPQIVILTDDIYEHIYWDAKPFCNIVMAMPELYDRTLVINGVSKTYAMTGWRIGFTAGPVEIIKAMTKIQSQSTSNPCSISQEAAVAALRMDKSHITPMITAFKDRYHFVYDFLKNIDGVELYPTHGAFYVFPYVQKIIEKMKFASDVEFSEHLLNNAGIAIIPGSDFGCPGAIRISFAASMETLEKALDRFKKFVQ